MDEPNWDLTLEWLEALKVVRAAGYLHAIPMLVRGVKVEWALTEILPVARIIHWPHNNTMKLDVSPALVWLTDYRVERLEILTYLAAECIGHMTRLDAPMLGSLCVKLGVANTRIITPRERWRRLGIELDPRLNEGPRAESLVSKMYEDRPLCGWCKGALVSGSHSLFRKDLHESCYDYIIKVVRPRMKAERQEQLRKKVVGEDK